MEHLLSTVCTHEWNRYRVADRSFAEGARLPKAEHPDKAELIDATAPGSPPSTSTSPGCFIWSGSTARSPASCTCML